MTAAAVQATAAAHGWEETADLGTVRHYRRDDLTLMVILGSPWSVTSATLTRETDDGTVTIGHVGVECMGITMTVLEWLALPAAACLAAGRWLP